MFNPFNRPPTPDRLVDRLRSPYADVVQLVGSIDGPFVNLYEAGVFVASVATAKILTFRDGDPAAFADQFNRKWVDFVVRSYPLRSIGPSESVVVLRLQEKFPVYREQVFKVIDPGRGSHDDAVQLMWELFSNCTGKQRPTAEASFLKLVLASGELVRVVAAVLKNVHE